MGEELKDLKKRRRAVKNRESALRSRERKRARMDMLERQVTSLQQRIQQLESENASLRQHQQEHLVVASRQVAAGGRNPPVKTELVTSQVAAKVEAPAVGVEEDMLYPADFSEEG